MATHFSTLAWKIPWTGEPGGLQSMGLRRVRQAWATSFRFSLSWVGEGNGNPLQCSCLENPRDGGAQWAAVYGVAQRRTRLKQLSSSSRIFSLMDGGNAVLFSLHPIKCQMVSICPILNDTHFESLDKLASAKFLHSKVIWSTFENYKYLGGGTLKLCKYLILHHCFYLFIHLLVSYDNGVSSFI